jgi:hypothetical protein
MEMKANLAMRRDALKKFKTPEEHSASQQRESLASSVTSQTDKDVEQRRMKAMADSVMARAAGFNKRTEEPRKNYAEVRHERKKNGFSWAELPTKTPPPVGAVEQQPTRTFFARDWRLDSPTKPSKTQEPIARSFRRAISLRCPA